MEKRICVHCESEFESDHPRKWRCDDPACIEDRRRVAQLVADHELRQSMKVNHVSVNDFMGRSKKTA